ncbi:MAG: voltage-gated chloride channel [Deltaproteobacteria bacterium]|nr:voltage-gated chloride channel [Deltaproteobacteria bacterium]
MKKKLLEESVLFVSVLKWTIIAACSGGIVGTATAIFLKVLNWSTVYTGQYPFYFLLLPTALFLSALTVQRIAPETKGYGMERVIQAVHKNSAQIRLIAAPTKAFVTILSATFGGSVGQIGPCAQIGAALTAFSANMLKFDDNDRKKLVICGISAGFASVLGAPIAGAIFSLEVLVAGSIMYEVLLPSFVASITSYHVSSLIGIVYMHHPLASIPPFTEINFLKVIAAGMFFGLCAFLFIEIMKLGEKLSRAIPWWEPLKGIVGGVVLIALTLVFSRDYLGLGIELTHHVLKGGEIVWYAFLLKTISTSITFGFGGSGGIIAPLICVGATAGSLFGTLLGMDCATFAAIGFVSVLSAAANTPIATSILAMELFGRAIGPYAAISCVVSFLIIGHRGIFPTQLLALRKSSSVEVEIGKEVGEVTTRFKPRDKSLIGIGLKIAKKIKKNKEEGDK